MTVGVAQLRQHGAGDVEQRIDPIPNLANVWLTTALARSRPSNPIDCERLCPIGPDLISYLCEFNQASCSENDSREFPRKPDRHGSADSRA
jgi:hypothetical protein